jgi:hypothetical protein
VSSTIDTDDFDSLPPCKVLMISANNKDATEFMELCIPCFSSVNTMHGGNQCNQVLDPPQVINASQLIWRFPGARRHR